MPWTYALLFFPAFFAIVSGCAIFQRHAPARRGDGWNYLTPGPYFWFGLSCGILISTIFCLVAAAGKGGSFSFVLLTAFFIAITSILCLQAISEQVRWNSKVLERRTLTGEIRRMAWNELAFHGAEWSGYYFASGIDGKRIRFSLQDNGAAILLMTIKIRAGQNGPPPETVPSGAGTLQTVPVLAGRR